jgi:diguanylate cyclase (GGDEF)-like protein/PAS domain S-box-containing protein
MTAQERIVETLHRMHLLDTSVDQEFKEVATFASKLAGAPIAFVSFGVEDVQRVVMVGDPTPQERKTAQCVAGMLHIGELGREMAEKFCNLQLPSPSAQDENKLEFAFAGMLLYAGFQSLGSLCVMDRGRREFSPDQLEMLTALAKQLSAQLEGRWQVTMQTQLNARLTESLARAAGSKGDAMLAASRLEALFHGMPIACFTFDLNLNVMEWNHTAEKLFGIPAHEAADHCVYDVLSNSRISNRANRLVESVLKGSAVAEVEWTYRRNDGKRLRISTSAFPIHDKHREIVGIVSAHVDLTDLREHGVALRASENRLKTVIASMRDGVVLQDRSGKITISNLAAERILGVSGNQVEGIASLGDGWRMVRPDGSDLSNEDHPASITLRTGEAVHDFVIGVQRPNDTLAWIEMDVTPLCGENSQGPNSLVCTFSDVTRRIEDEKIIQQQLIDLSDYSLQMDVQQLELEEANRRLEALATSDGLTGLMNHRTFQDGLERELRLANRNGTQISLIFLDIDSFKSFNDEFGHQAGDEVLRGVALALKDAVRETDIVARYGGEEVVVILPNTDAEGAKLVSEKLRASLEETEWTYRKVTASFGVTTLTHGVQDRQILIEQADRALYHSKSTGRNRVTHYWDLPGVPSRETQFRTECA